MLFISTENLFSFPKSSNFCLDRVVMWNNDLIRKIRLISKRMMSQLGEETIAMHILSNISRGKGNQTMKFD